MDWRVLLTTFGVIFLAEMGDKTQIAAMTMAAEKKRPWEVFIAASLALTLVSAIGVVVGSLMSKRRVVPGSTSPLNGSGLPTSPKGLASWAVPSAR